MTRRIRLALVALTCAAACAGWLAVSSATGSDEQRYTVVLDNAFGLTEGADLRSDGVRIGTVEQLDVQRRTARALATIVIDRPDFAGLRRNVHCDVKPQSLIGEYYMDCDPGTSRDPAPSVIPVTQTSGTIAPDLVLDILRRPARERFGLILSELGVGLAARGEDLQTTIRRGVPALRETDKVLHILDRNRQTLQGLARDADQVLVKLAGNRQDVGRFISAARDTTAASADRSSELAATVRKLPTFLRELRPTLRDLGTAATLQTPALADLRAAAPDLTTLLRRLGPFADSARPAVRSLGDASVTGIGAAKEARSTVAELRRLGTRSPEPTKNLRYVLEDVDSRSRATEPNRLSPGGQGFTGLEAVLQYLFVQSQSINIFDSRGYLLKLELLVNDCSQYTNAETARTQTARTAKCKQWLGPNQPGVTTTGAQTASALKAPAPGRQAAAVTQPAPPAAPAGAPAAPAAPQPAPAAPSPSAASQQSLLDFLLAP